MCGFDSVPIEEVGILLNKFSLVLCGDVDECHDVDIGRRPSSCDLNVLNEAPVDDLKSRCHTNSAKSVTQSEKATKNTPAFGTRAENSSNLSHACTIGRRLRRVLSRIFPKKWR